MPGALYVAPPCICALRPALFLTSFDAHPPSPADEDLAEKIFSAGKGCRGGDSNANSDAEGGGEDSCAEGNDLGDSMYWGYTCNYDLQPLGCTAQDDKDGVCRTNSPATSRDGNFAEKLFENDECKLPSDADYDEAQHGNGGEKGCDGRWNDGKPERFTKDVEDAENTCRNFAKRAYNDGVTARPNTAKETCAETFTRAERREAAASADSARNVIIGAVVGLGAAAACFVTMRARKRQREQPPPQQVTPVMAMAQPQIIQAATQMDVAVPPGFPPGSTLQVAAPNGMQIAVQVPQGAGPGTVIRVPIPAPTPIAAVATPTTVAVGGNQAKMTL